MKKLVVSIILLSMLLMIFPFGISVSAEESFDEEEAMALYQGAEDLRHALLNNATSAGINERKPYFVVDLNDTVDFGNYDVYYKIISYYDRGVSYEADTEEKLKHIVGKYYSDDTIDAFLSFINHYDDEDNTFYFDSVRNVYLYEPRYTPFWSYDVIGGTRPQISGNKASLNLIITRTGAPGLLEYLSVPATYIKTNNGWKLDSVVFDTIQGGWVDIGDMYHTHVNIYKTDQPFNTPYLSQAQAELLLEEAYHRWIMIQEGGKDHIIGHFIEDDIRADTSYSGRTLFEKKQDGSEYQYSSTPEQLDYIPVTDKRFDTIEKCYDYLEWAFTDDWADLIMNKHYYPVNQELYAPIRLSNGGKLYSTDGSSSETWEDGVVMRLHPFRNSSNDIQRLYDIGTVSLSGNKAEIKVTLLIDKNYDNTSSRKTVTLDERTWNSYEKSITFVYTEDGWRVSGGTLFGTLMNKWNSVKSPFTSDQTPVTVTILGIIAVISLALPVVIYKRRRRVV